MKESIQIINKSHLGYSKLDEKTKAIIDKAVARLDKVSNPAIKHEIGGIPKSKLIEERQAELRASLVEHKVGITDQGLDLIVENIKRHGSTGGVQDGRLFVYSKEQEDRIKQALLADKNYISSDKGQEMEKAVLQAHTTHGRVHNRKHEIGFDDGQMLVASRYDMITDAEHVLAPIEDSYKAKNAQELLEASQDGIEAETDMTKMTKSELKLSLKGHGLKVSGKKADLQARLSEHIASQLLNK